MADTPAGDGTARVLKRSVRIAGHPTSISLEEPFWSELKRIAAARGLSLNALVTAVDAGRPRGNLSSALRLLVVAELQRAAGHR
ncbi:MAG: ribbon-helix-helix domain-containing protein [Alphaproteobacteria bacterium]